MGNVFEEVEVVCEFVKQVSLFRLKLWLLLLILFNERKET